MSCSRRYAIDDDIRRASFACSGLRQSEVSDPLETYETNRSRYMRDWSISVVFVAMKVNYSTRVIFQSPPSLGEPNTTDTLDGDVEPQAHSNTPLASKSFTTSW